MSKTNKKSTNNKQQGVPRQRVRTTQLSERQLIALIRQHSNKQTPKTRRQPLQQKNTGFAPISQATALISRRPQGQNNVHNIKHAELIKNINHSGDLAEFEVQADLRCNPASKTTFNWLSNIAINYESFKFNKLRFISYPRCSTTQAGSIIMSPDYDASDNVPSTEIGMSSNVDTVEDAPWKTIIAELDPKAMNRAYKSHFCMTDDRFVQTSSDKKTIDPARFLVAAVLSTGAPSSFSKLWVEYDIDFYLPQNPTEFLNKGGGVHDFAASMANPALPLTVITSSVMDAQPLLKADDAYSIPGNKVGTFARDWSGVWNSTASGTGLTGYATGLLNGASLGLVDNIFYANAAGTQASKSYRVDAKQGDVLTLGSFAGIATTLSQINNQFGASSSF